MSTPTPRTDAGSRPPVAEVNIDSSGATNKPLAAITWPVPTERLTRRRATRDDPATLEEYHTSFDDPASLAKTLIIEIDGQVIGDLMLQIEDAWAQAEVSAQVQPSLTELVRRAGPWRCRGLVRSG